jgi:hypothetical protein
LTNPVYKEKIISFNFYVLICVFHFIMLKALCHVWHNLLTHVIGLLAYISSLYLLVCSTGYKPITCFKNETAIVASP